MALDEQSKILLEQIKSLNAPPVNTVPPEKSRELFEQDQNNNQGIYDHFLTHNF